jgi:hypothetical protein
MHEFNGYSAVREKGVLRFIYAPICPTGYLLHHAVVVDAPAYVVMSFSHNPDLNL